LEDARLFWNRFDSLRNGRTVKDIANSIGVEYELIRVQRTRYRIPKASIVVLLARELGTTTEFLVTGENNDQLPSYLRAIVNRLLIADEVDVQMVQRILKIENNDDNKQQEKRKIQ